MSVDETAVDEMSLDKLSYRHKTLLIFEHPNFEVLLKSEMKEKKTRKQQ